VADEFNVIENFAERFCGVVEHDGAVA
jgi:hypothetical protein